MTPTIAIYGERNFAADLLRINGYNPLAGDCERLSKEKSSLPACPTLALRGMGIG
ncbi:hypothetical protein [Paenibacillus algorifonticola]|uniref:hypothetical protein n=1 Tax=Paenibacillus algorifonticola TaxID=684063 RepID=UPI000B2D683B|nr:hypothetical protein [Paenibacillus algorifonticola]